MQLAINLALGLGIFLFGMRQLEQSLEALSSDHVKQILGYSTGHPLGSVASGTLITAILQSSSMVSLIVLAFASAGMIPLFNAVGVILGANLGTTFTGWIVATLGFKLNLEAFALPLFGFAALAQIYSRAHTRWHALSGIFIGLGLLLLGLVHMKEAVNELPSLFKPDLIGGLSPFLFLLLGTGLTAVMQSSSAIMMIALTALNGGVIDLASAAALVIGADIGTTSTTALGSIKSTAIAKQLAMSHVIYNLVVDAFAFLLMLPWLDEVLAFMGITDPLYGLVAFHSSFNLIGLCIFVPLLRPYSRWISHFFNKTPPPVTRYLHLTPVDVPEAATIALFKELRGLLAKVLWLNIGNLKLDVSQLGLSADERNFLEGQFLPSASFDMCYAEVKILEGEIHRYLSALQGKSLSPSYSHLCNDLTDCARDGIYSAKTLKDVRDDLSRFAQPRQASAENSPGVSFPIELLQMYSFFSERILHGGSVLNQFNLDSLHATADAGYQLLHADILDHVEEESIDYRELATLLNANREVWHSCESLVKAIGHFQALQNRLDRMGWLSGDY